MQEIRLINLAKIINKTCGYITYNELLKTDILQNIVNYNFDIEKITKFPYLELSLNRISYLIDFYIKLFILEKVIHKHHLELKNSVYIMSYSEYKYEIKSYIQNYIQTKFIDFNKELFNSDVIFKFMDDANMYLSFNNDIINFDISDINLNSSITENLPLLNNYLNILIFNDDDYYDLYDEYKYIMDN
jgi:hypothetical protein